MKVIDTVEAALADIVERDGQLHAWQAVDLELARRQARALDAGPAGGLLHGMTLGVKDIFDTADLPTEYGSPIYAGHRPAWDAACVALARAAGAVVIGKTVTTEFATMVPARTKSPRPAPHARRLLERQRGRGRRGHGALRLRLADRRLDHPAGGVLRRGWLKPSSAR